ncbi:hypothetical protein [Microbacterium thalli]|uniref:Bacitracin resistance protein n=1 Tax=Microbacterium thalli TaxID=3027921 RepID=A0ABT5SIM9_9MICO|nr:hypothetical protein [Microbacterium thalli]MDD7929847.1 hypothetical protein [Microbacterium thalli]MDD7962655.1 hypothetical protein [Microbacterium thalli]
MTTGSVPATRHRTPTWLVATVAGAFGLFYAYAVWVAVGHLVTQATGVQGLNGAGWAVLGSAIVFPILVFAAAFALGYRRRAGAFALLLLAGLGLVAVFWLNILSYSITAGGSLLGG